MGLIKYKLGELIESSDLRNRDTNNKYLVDDVKGISTNKEFIETKANLNNVNLGLYKVVQLEYFAYVADTSRRGNKISLAFNDLERTVIVSSISTVFNVTRRDLLEPYYLFIYFNRPEFDRFSRFNSWGSARETFSWDDFCDIELELPSLDIQKKYVAVYESLLANQKAYEEGLEDLKLACDATINKLIDTTKKDFLGKYIQESSIRVRDLEEHNFSLEDIKGISSIDKCFIETKANTKNLSLQNYKIVPNEYFAFNPNTARMGDKIPVAMNKDKNSVLVSSIYPVFTVNKNIINPLYLSLYLSRPNFDRYARYHSWGSARETFDFQDMQEVNIPLPDIKTQNAIADIYTAYTERKEINEKLKLRLKNICPILIKEAMEEASREEA
ncbi:MAG TPA: restriction endonuclease subunit S [Clostridiaceae bacterium]|nr:restriction endonuclease subunit S [Clostridiaceae bacterium]